MNKNLIETTHHQTIEKLGGTMPEDLPVAEKSIRQLEKESRIIDCKK